MLAVLVGYEPNCMGQPCTNAVSVQLLTLQLLLIRLRLADVSETPATAAGYCVAMRATDRALFCAVKFIRSRTRARHTTKGDTLMPDHSNVLRCCWKWSTSQYHALDVERRSGIGLRAAS